MEPEDIDESNQSKPVMLFGRDIRKVPCFKRSMLNGIYSGLATGLVTFMLTSRVRFSTNMALGSYMGVSVVYWCYCRYDHVMQKYAFNDIQYIMRQRSMGIKEEDDETFQQQPKKLVDA
ncbi:cytochrome c oxidase assembly protein COX20, mitochondrial [Nylanderia fulva]|uniref:cytochrome c oxidase assembly protein COX20, mitochondrial n=1 Tax=Nylanderia fulva TaxID=613905 RepID=UPI0010FB76B4|nr:cytochrome c oxidase assembly protein COX20, mitochondrial [Nylanderia fulva]XP_029173218.1 cytochrome c oxidase assembly protein COX20, mitochondrial [Nylanderia fulva]